MRVAERDIVKDRGIIRGIGELADRITT